MEVSLRLLLFLFFIFSFALLVSSTSDETLVNGAFWDNFFSEKLTHQLSGTDDKVYSEMAAMETSNYPGPFKVPLDKNTTYRAKVALHTYKRLVVFYRGTRGETDECSALIRFGTNPTPLCIKSGEDNSTAPDAPLYVFSQEINYAPVNIRVTFTNHAVAGQNVSGYRFYYLMYNVMQPISFPPSNATPSYPVPVPALLATDTTFPVNDSRSVRYNLTDVSINVLLYDTILVKLLIADVSMADCSQAYFEIGLNTKLCGNNTNATIDVSGKRIINAVYRYTVPPPSTNVGMLVEIIGTVRTPHRYELCSQASLPNSISQGVFYSSNYPTNNTPAVGRCQRSFSNYSQMISYTIDWTNPSGAGDCSKAKLLLNGLQDGSATVVCSGSRRTSENDKILYQPFSIVYQQLTSVQQPGFAFQFNTLHFKSICSPSHSSRITTLPYRLMSPNFPHLYSIDEQCFAIFNFNVSKITIDFKVFQLEESRNCEHDFLQVPGRDKFCGDSLHGEKRVYNVSRNSFIYFRSDGSVSKQGFALEITSADLPLATTTTATATTVTTTTKATSGATTTTTTKKAHTITSTTIIASSKLTPSATPSQVPTKTPEVTSNPTKSSITTNPSKVSPGSGVSSKTTATAKKPASSTNPGKPAVAKVKKDSGIPGYVWGILVTVLLVALAAAVAIVVFLKRRRSHFRLNETNGLDVGFENPIYGSRQDGEMVRLNSDSSN